MITLKKLTLRRGPKIILDKASITIGDPKMWDVPTEAYVPAELRGVKTSWYHQIARVADKIVV